jgi:hypothetical protein
VDLADVGPTLAALAGLSSGAADGVGLGRDLLVGPAPAERVRVSESVYANQRYGWAQLLSATDAHGTLVDAGGDRLHWLEPAPFLQPQPAPLPASGRAGLDALGRALAAYRVAERSERISGGQTAGGYGGGNAARPFLSPAENGRLPDPYAAIPRAYALDALASGLLRGLDPARLARSLAAMASDDPRNPEVRFWLGRARTEEARRAEDPAPALAAAEAAYLEAFDLGRRDADTLVLAAGVNARGREEEMLARIQDLGQGLREDCRVRILQARLLRALPGREADAERACREAEAACTSARERALLEKARAEETGR